VDLAGIIVRKAATDSDFQIVARLREDGFSRIPLTTPSNGTKAHTCWIDELDRQPGVFSLIGYACAGKPVATMRVQDGRVSPLELARFVPLDSLLSGEEKPAAQFARLSVTKRNQAADVMFGLFKAAWGWCLREGIPSIVIATPPWSKPVYDFMFFEDLGIRGHFSHAFAGYALHVAMRLPVSSAEQIWRAGASPMCKQFLDVTHPALILD